MSRPFAIVTGFIALVALAAIWASRPSSPEATRIVLLTLDTLRYDAFAGSSEHPSVMPVSLAEAGRGLVYERCYAATSTTQPSHASMFTGLHPWEHGVTRNGLELGAEFATVAEILEAEGFATGAAVASFPVSSRFGFAQGFERFREEETAPAGKLEKGGPGYVLAPKLVERALELLDQTTASRQFFWFHFIDPHSPYGDTEGERSLKSESIVRLERRTGDPATRKEEIEREVRHARELYLRDAASLDRELARLFERLRRDESRFETHLVVAADHGEAFGEGGIIGHGKWLGEATLRVPCFVVSPRVRPGRRADVVASVDFFPTMLSLARVAPRPGAGRDLLGRPAAPSEAVGMRRTFAQPQRLVLLDGRVEWLERDQFYVVDDSGSLHVGDATEIRTEGGRLDDRRRSEISGRFSELAAAVARKPAVESLNDAEIDALRALGYVQ